MGSGYIQRAAPINSFPPVLPALGQDVVHDITGAREEQNRQYIFAHVFSELQPPLEKWCFLLDDDKPHYNFFFFKSTCKKCWLDAGWTFREWFILAQYSILTSLMLSHQSFNHLSFCHAQVLGAQTHHTRPVYITKVKQRRSIYATQNPQILRFWCFFRVRALVSFC